MTCDEYLELFSAHLDGALTEAEERALEEHQSCCPACRAAGAQLAALQPAFDELEDVPAPEGFAQGVMDRIRAEEPKKIIPLFKRPQFRAIAGLAACAVLAVGLYGAAHPQQKNAAEEEFDLMVRSFNRDAQEVLTENSDVPQATAYSDLSMPIEGSDESVSYAMQKTIPESDFSYDSVSPAAASPMSASAVLVLDRMPEGAEEFVGEWASVTYDLATNQEGYNLWPAEEAYEALAEIEHLAQEQGITGSRATGAALEEATYDLIILNPEH